MAQCKKICHCLSAFGGAHCGVHHISDVNAAINLRNMAVCSNVTACGEEGFASTRKCAVEPASMKQEAKSNLG